MDSFKSFGAFSKVESSLEICKDMGKICSKVV